MVSKIHLKKQQINYSYGQIGLRSYTTEQRYLPVPLFHQEQSWYCGPASVQMISTYLYGTTYSQDGYCQLYGNNPIRRDRSAPNGEWCKLLEWYYILLM